MPVNDRSVLVNQSTNLGLSSPVLSSLGVSYRRSRARGSAPSQPASRVSLNPATSTGQGGPSGGTPSTQARQPKGQGRPVAGRGRSRCCGSILQGLPLVSGPTPAQARYGARGSAMSPAPLPSSRCWPRASTLALLVGLLSFSREALRPDGATPDSLLFC